MAKILIVDDSGLARRILRKVLKPTVHQIIEAPDGMTALEQYSLHQPDLVLMDIEVQDELKGIDLASQMRKNFDVPIVYITAHSDEKIVDKAGIVRAVALVNDNIVAQARLFFGVKPKKEIRNHY